MSAATAQGEPLLRYREAFDGRDLSNDAASEQRRAAFEHFLKLGFPAPREEAWKYTSLRRLESRKFAPSPRGLLPDAGALSSTLAGPRIVLVNGEPRSELSCAPDQTGGLRVSSLEESLAGGGSAAALLRVPVGGGTERFAALNAAMCPDALLIEVERDARPTQVLHLLLMSCGDTPLMSHPRIVLRAAAGSEARIVLHHVGAGEPEHFVNAFVDVEVGPDAQLHVYRMLEGGAKTFHIERIEATVAQRGRFVLHDAQLGASLARLDVTARLAAPDAAAELTGLFLADGTRHLDTQLRVDHLATGTRSLQDYRGIAAGRGRAVFNGKAVVHQGAQQSVSRQVSRNLLLSSGAEIDTKPELEIYADDVQCSHGATTGQLDPAALFYLRSRGLDESEARNALTRAFTGAVVSRMDHEPFARLVHDQLDSRLLRLLDHVP
jgi:Fe-S cluster assembly protein SufD